MRDHVTTGDDWFFDELERWRKLFETNPSYATGELSTKFKQWDELINEDDTSLKERPSASRSLRSRKRRKLRAVLNDLGSEVLLLCTLATTVTRLQSVNEEHLVPRLKEWWRTVQHPVALKKATAELEEPFPRTFSKDTNEYHGSTKEGERSCTAKQSEGIFSVSQDENPLPKNQGEDRVTIVDFKLHDLLEFLTTKNMGNQDVSYQFICPWNGKPQFAEMGKGAFEAASLKMEFSVELGSQWCDYLYLKRRTEGVP
jgi:hypothetical protein